MREIDPDFAPVRPRHAEDGLAVQRDATLLLHRLEIDQQSFVLAGGGHDQRRIALGPSFEMRHLVDRQFRATGVVTGRDAIDLRGCGPQVDMREAVLAEQPGEIVSRVTRDIGVVGQPADVCEFRQRRRRARREIRDPDLVGVIERIGESASGQIDEADGLGTLAVRADRRDGCKFGKAVSVEDLDAARRVVGSDNQRAIVGNGAADRIACLDDASVDPAGEHVDLGQPAVATEHIGVSLARAENGGRMREIAQAIDSRNDGACRGIDDQNRTGRALDDEAEVASAAGRRAGRRAVGGKRRRRQPRRDGSREE